jgi:hypothetical protein
MGWMEVKETRSHRRRRGIGRLPNANATSPVHSPTHLPTSRRLVAAAASSLATSPQTDLGDAIFGCRPQSCVGRNPELSTSFPRVMTIVAWQQLTSAASTQINARTVELRQQRDCLSSACRRRSSGWEWGPGQERSGPPWRAGPADATLAVSASLGTRNKTVAARPCHLTGGYVIDGFPVCGACPG